MWHLADLYFNVETFPVAGCHSQPRRARGKAGLWRAGVLAVPPPTAAAAAAAMVAYPRSLGGLAVVKPAS